MHDAIAIDLQEWTTLSADASGEAELLSLIEAQLRRGYGMPPAA